jgi:O-antigen ligase
MEAVLKGQSRVGANERLNAISSSLYSSCLIAISFKRTFLSKTSLVSVLTNICCLSVGLYSLLLTSSRGPLLFLSIYLILLLFHSARSNMPKTLAIILFVVIGFVGIIQYFGLGEIFYEMFISRFTTVAGSSIDESAEGRAVAYQGAISQFLSSPFIGSFLEERTLKQYPHNIIIESFMALGIFGGLLFVVIYSRCVFFCISDLIKSNFSALFTISLGSCVIVLFSGGLAFSIDFWFGYALSAVFFAKMRKQRCRTIDTKYANNLVSAKQ